MSHKENAELLRDVAKRLTRKSSLRPAFGPGIDVSVRFLRNLSYREMAAHKKEVAKARDQASWSLARAAAFGFGGKQTV